MSRPPAAEMIYGVHPVLELLEARGETVDRVFVVQGRHAGLGRLLRRARELGVPVSHLSRAGLARKLGGTPGHQGVAAQVAASAYVDVEMICRGAAAGPASMLVLADRVVDPRNLGAMVRTSAAAGVTGLILGTGQAVGLTAAVAKVAAGALDRVPIGRESRPARRIAALRHEGFRAIALDPRGRTCWDRADLTGRIIFVAGGEERGPSPAVLRACDARVGIPLAGGVESLNVAVALGVLLFEAVRQRRAVSGDLETSTTRC